ncbi:MAG TPA: CopD family protein [Pseudonocardiaceae bacterium]|nr:CopD family protein [Pseudonocardiaceae bacterium]
MTGQATAVSGSVVTTDPRPRYPLLVVLVGCGIAGVLIAFVLTGTAAVPGIVAPNTAVALGLPLSRMLVDVSAVVTVGMSLLPKLALSDRPKRLSAALSSARLIAVVSAGVWLVAALASLFLENLDTNAGVAFSWGELGDYIKQIGEGQALIVVAACALIYVVIGLLAVRNGEEVPAELRITVAVFTLLPLSITGHAAFGVQSLRDLGLISIELHVVAAVAWTGGLLAVIMLLVLDRQLLGDALPRFSKLATVCVFLTGFTGLFNGWYELYSTPGIHWYVAVFTTGYGWILIGKIVCVGLAGLLGGYTRFRLLPQIVERRTTAVLSWATMEVGVLALAFGLAAVLIRAPVVTAS